MANQEERADSRQSVTARRSPGILLSALTGLYLAFLGLIALGNAVGAEWWWFGSLNLYLPQWLWALPAFPLFFWFWRSARGWSWVPLAAILFVAGPLMGFCWRWDNVARAGSRGKHLRVMSYNIKWGARDGSALAAEVAEAHPDVILMQDAAGGLDGPLGKVVQSWNMSVREMDQYIIASRYPLTEPEVRWISYPQHNHRVMRCQIQLDGTPVTLYSVHLMTPRWALGALKHPRSQGLGALEANVNTRVQRATLLTENLKGEDGPLIVAGDFNAPVQSSVCKKLFEIKLRDAFSTAGRGYGYTYGHTTRVGSPYVRIDHVLVSPEWQVEDSWAGGSEGSDHCPVITDLFLPQAP